MWDFYIFLFPILMRQWQPRVMSRRSPKTRPLQAFQQAPQSCPLRLLSPGRLKLLFLYSWLFPPFADTLTWLDDISLLSKIGFCFGQHFDIGDAHLASRTTSSFAQSPCFGVQRALSRGSGSVSRMIICFGPHFHHQGNLVLSNHLVLQFIISMTSFHCSVPPCPITLPLTLPSPPSGEEDKERGVAFRCPRTDMKIKRTS